MISLGALHTSPCRGGNYCYWNEEHDCIQKDDMQDVFETLSKADTIVIAIPVYFYGVSAQMETVMDCLHIPNRSVFKVKGLVLLSVAADMTHTLFDSVIAQYDSIIRYFKLKDHGKVLVNGAAAPSDIKGREELNEAFELGRI